MVGWASKQDQQGQEDSPGFYELPRPARNPTGLLPGRRNEAVTFPFSVVWSLVFSDVQSFVHPRE